MKINNNFQKEKLNNQAKNKLKQQNLSFDDLDGIEPSLPIDWLKPKNEELKITKKTKNGVRPWSAYALFFRQVQTEIRSQCGNISFGELSKTIANKWEKMEKKEKMVYNEQLKERRRRLLQTKAKVHTFQLIFGGGNNKKEISD